MSVVKSLLTWMIALWPVELILVLMDVEFMKENPGMNPLVLPIYVVVGVVLFFFGVAWAADRADFLASGGLEK